MKNEKKFKRLINDAWEALKAAYHPKYHAKLRNTLLKIIAAEDTEFTDFVELMKVSGYDTVFNNAAGYEMHMKGKTRIDKINDELRAAFDEAEPAPDEEDSNNDNYIIQCSGCREFIPFDPNADMSNGVLCEKCAKGDGSSDGSQVLHRCHYCGDMYHVSELTGCKMGLVCYKCRHELENRD